MSAVGANSGAVTRPSASVILTACPVSTTLTPLRVTSVAPYRALSRRYAVTFVGCGKTDAGAWSTGWSFSDLPRFVLVLIVLPVSQRLVAVAFAIQTAYSLCDTERNYLLRDGGRDGGRLAREGGTARERDGERVTIHERANLFRRICQTRASLWITAESGQTVSGSPNTRATPLLPPAQNMVFQNNRIYFGA